MLKTIMLKYIIIPIACIFLLFIAIGICTSLPKPFGSFPLITLMVPMIWKSWK